MSDRNRREFLRATTAGLALAGLGSTVLAEQEDSPDGLPKRPLGKTGEKVSIIALGGWHIGSIDPNEAISIMHQAIDEGLTFFDNAWDYHDGGSEEIMGKVLADGNRRDKVFLMTKNCERDYEDSKRNLEDSLRRLKTDRIDLWQFHEINYDNDPDWIFERGAIKAAIEAQKEGKVRYIGFTGHKHPDIHLAMIEKPFEWDTVQMPINIMDAQYRSFQQRVVPVCVRRGIGVIGMKALGGQGWIPKMSGLTVEQCRRFALSLPISALVCGITSKKELMQDIQIARNFKPMDRQEFDGIVQATFNLARDGRCELFKSTQQFDGMYHQIQHGFKQEGA